VDPALEGESASGLAVLAKLASSNATGRSEATRPALSMLEATAGIRYRGISLGWALRVAFHAYQRERLTSGGMNLRRARRLLRETATLLWSLARGPGWRRAVAENLELAAAQPGGQVVVASDYSNHTEKMVRDCLEGFPPSAVLLVTASRTVHSRLRRRFPSCLDVYGVLRYFDWRLFLRSLRLSFELWKRLPGKSLSLAIFLLSRVPSVIQAIEFYERFFAAARARAVMTVCDTICHEYLMTVAARRAGVLTYTNLHGDPAVLFNLIPVASDRVFVWGERSRDHLVRNGVPPEKVLMSGNPKFDSAFSHYLPRRREIRAELERLHGLEPGRPIVTYLSSGLLSTPELTESASFDLLRSFLRALTGGAAGARANVVVKLHPTSDSPTLYRKWIEGLGGGLKVALLQKEDLFEVLAVTGIAVTFHSTTGLEAIGFGIPALVMNFLPGVDVRRYITYAEDALVTDSEESLREILGELLLSPERYREEAERTRKGRAKYFRNSEDFSASRFLRDELLGPPVREPGEPLRAAQ